MNMFRIGDWVTGTSIQDERFLGYIEEIEAENSLVAIRVLKADRPEAIGKVVHSQMRKIKRSPDQPIASKGNLLNLIDLALSSKDEIWFLELTHKLKSLRLAEVNQESEYSKGQSFPKVNRLS